MTTNRIFVVVPIKCVFCGSALDENELTVEWGVERTVKKCETYIRMEMNASSLDGTQINTPYECALRLR